METIKRTDKLRDLKEFYKRVMVVVLPIIIQNAISNFVGLLDNIMIGRVGTDQMSGVAIDNQLFFVFYLCIFGAISGAGIFTAQFYGKGDHEGVRDTLRFKIIISLIILAVGCLLFTVFQNTLISIYLHDGSTTGNLEATLGFGKEYMTIMLIGLLPFIFECCYSGTLRETGETFIPMVASFAAVFINLILNYILIFGKFGFPVMGVAGAAWATVISRFIQATIVIVWTHSHQEKNQFAIGVYKSFKIRKGLTKEIVVLGMPLLLNETLWSAGIAIQTQAYSVRGLAVIAGLNISQTISGMFNVAFFAMGDAVAIIVGQMLGAGKLKEAKQSAYRIIALSVGIGTVCGALMYMSAALFPQIYNTTDEVKAIATSFMKVCAILTPVQSFLHATYFTIRSGGKTFITFLFDSCFLWVVSVPAAYILSTLTTIDIVSVYFICLALDTIKLIIGLVLLVKGVWINNLTEVKTE